MKKLFNVKSLLLALVLVCMFGVVSASAAATPFAGDDVSIDGKLFLKSAGFEDGVKYYTISSEDNVYTLGSELATSEAYTGATAAKYYQPIVKVQYVGLTDTIKVSVFKEDGSTKFACDVYAFASDKAAKSIKSDALVKKSFTATATADFSILDDLKLATGKDAYVYLVLNNAHEENISKPADLLSATIAKGTVDVSAVVVKYWLMVDAGTDSVIAAKKKVNSVESDIVESTDGKLTFKIDDGSWALSTKDTTASVPGYTSDDLYTSVGYVAGKKSPKLYVRVTGTDGAQVVAGSTALSTAKRPGKEKSVSLKIQAKAPSVKFDSKTGTIAIKNGFDYQKVEATSAPTDAEIAAYALNSWKTIIPYNAAGTASEEADTSTYVPQAKFIAPGDGITNNNESSYTSTKKKTHSVVATDDKNYVWVVRKSATLSAPASCACVIIVPKTSAAPTVGTASNVEGVKGKTAEIVVPTLTKSSDDASLADVKFEFAVINKADYPTVEWDSVKWTSIAAGKKIKANAKTKYYTSADVAASETYGDKLVATEHLPAYNTGAVLVIRRAGATSTTSSIVPSNNAFVRIRAAIDGTKVTYSWTVMASKDAALAAE